MKITLLNISQNIQISEEFKKKFLYYDIVEYNDINKYYEYLYKKHKQINYSNFTLEKFKSNFEYIYLITDNSKNDIKYIKNTLYNITTIPFHIITINPSNNNIQKINTNIGFQKNKWFKKRFLKSYCMLIDKNINFDSIISKIEYCPICGKNDFVLEHDYDGGSYINIYLKCLYCNEHLINKTVVSKLIFDANYIFNKNIKVLMDKYVQNYPHSNNLLSEIYTEFDNTETVGYLFC
jgi:hypothetical protein